MSNMRAAAARDATCRPRPESDDALDLGATVLPVLAKAYWKQALGVLLVLLGAAVPARSAPLGVSGSLSQRCSLRAARSTAAQH